MGQVRVRKTKAGVERYQALYDDARGRRQSAGTFDTEREAIKAWHDAEAEIARGGLGDRRRGRQTFEAYARKWLQHHVLEPSTRQDYTYKIEQHLISFFGPMKMRHILPEHVREWVSEMQRKGAKPATIQKCKRAILNAIFTTALEDQVIVIHPSRGVKIPPVPEPPRKIITAEQFDRIYHALPNAVAQLMVETNIESGLRWGELTELRVKDLNFDTRILTVTRAVVELQPEFHPEGGRFLVQSYPKGKKPRRFKLSKQIVKKLKTFVDAKGLNDNDLFFKFWDDGKPKVRKQRPALVEGPHGKTDPDERGRTYNHGSLTAYTTGRCRCDFCKEAYRIYRAERRATGKDKPRKRRKREIDEDGHIPAAWFREQVWKKARTAAKLEDVTSHDLRHAHASWLLAGGADLQVVKERLGHKSIATTEQYLHTLPNADETALDALDKIRGPQPAVDEEPESNARKDELDALKQENDRLRAAVADMAVKIHTAGAVTDSTASPTT